MCKITIAEIFYSCSCRLSREHAHVSLEAQPELKLLLLRLGQGSFRNTVATEEFFPIE